MIYKHLSEIKYRILFSFVAWSFMMVNCYYFKETLLYVFIRFNLNVNNENLLYFLTTDVAEVFLAYVQLSYYLANQITVIFGFCQIFIFFSSGLYLFEYAYLRTVTIITIICWVVCLYILNNFFFPFSWDFFLKFQECLVFQNLTFYFEVKLNEYLTFYKSIYHLVSLIYQIMVLFFIFLDLFGTHLLVIQKLRKIIYYIFFMFSTLLTPPEVIYQVMLSICLIIIYELIIFYAVFETELAYF